MKKVNDRSFAYAVVDILITLFLAVSVYLGMIAAEEPKKNEDDQLQHLLTVLMFWDMARDADVDLWVKSPDDYQTGFSRMHGKHCDLVRDDLGRSQDPDSRNMEIQFCRKAVPGEYIVNTMLYRSVDQKFPVHVKIVVKMGKETVAERELDLTKDGEEETALRFMVDDQGQFVPGSVHYEFTPLFFQGVNVPTNERGDHI